MPFLPPIQVTYQYVIFYFLKIFIHFLGSRVEDFLMEKIDRRRMNRLSNLDYLGVDMVEAGNDLGPGTLYGTSLIAYFKFYCDLIL